MGFEAKAKSEKESLRTRYRHERHERFIDHSYAHLLRTPEFISATTIASYFSYGDEPSTKALNEGLLKEGKRVLIPRINGDFIEWVEWDGSSEKIKVGKKLSEPIGEVFTDSTSIDLIIVPALRVDRSGYRLGQGGGYYDRALPLLRAWRIGLIHPDEISGSDLPREAHDIPLNAAATHDLILRFKG